MEQKLNDWMWKCQHCCKLRIYWWMSVIRFVPFPGSPTLHCNQWGSRKYIFSTQVEPLFERWVHSTTIPAWIPVQKWRSVFPYLNIGGNMSNWSNSCMVKNKDQIPYNTWFDKDVYWIFKTVEARQFKDPYWQCEENENHIMCREPSHDKGWQG